MSLYTLLRDKDILGSGIAIYEIRGILSSAIRLQENDRIPIYPPTNESAILLPVNLQSLVLISRVSLFPSPF